MNSNFWTTFQPNISLKKQYIPSSDILDYNYIYLYNLNTEEQIELKLVPQTVNESYSPNITPASPFGTIRPYYFYGGGNSKTISFSIDLHEDLDNVDGSIYTLVDKIKRLSYPYVESQGSYSVIREPLVYMQLGNQFAGTGHVNISFQYSGPYDVVTGRYKTINMTITFVYHETYDQLAVDFDRMRIDYPFDQDYSQGLAHSIISLTGNISNKYTQNLLNILVDFESLGRFVFNDEKIKKVFNIALSSIKSTGTGGTDDGLRDLELNELRNAIKSGYSASKDELLLLGARNYLYNPHAIDLYNLYIDLVTIMHPNNVLKVGEHRVTKLLQDLLQKVDKAEKYFSTSRDRLFDLNTILNIKIDKYNTSGIRTWYYTEDIEYYPGPYQNPLVEWIKLKPIYKLRDLYTNFCLKNNQYMDNENPDLEAQYEHEAIEALSILQDKVSEVYYSSELGGWYEWGGYIYSGDIQENKDISDGFQILKTIVELQIKTLNILYGAGG